MKRIFTLILLLTLLAASLAACTSNSDQTGANTAATDVQYTVSDKIELPRLSRESGHYPDSFTLTVSVPKGTTVRYTTDGSQPTAQSEIFPTDGLLIKDRSNQKNELAAVEASKFTAESDHTPPKVNKGTVIRAAAFDSKGNCSRTVTASYFVGLYYEDIKMVSLVMDSEDLFGYEKGIYVFGRYYDEWMRNDPEAKNAETWELEGNFSQKGREWERPVTVQLIENDGSLGFEQDMGIRIMGAATRRYYQKSFRLTAREDYGKKHLEYDLIDGLVTDSDGQPLQKYKSFLLRNGGNDYGYAVIRDPFIQSLLSDREFATQATEPAIVFINGEYWGLYTITEDYSDNYVQYNFGVDNENVVIVKNFEVDEGKPEDIELFEPINEATYSRDFTSLEDYRWLCDIIDMQSFIDFMAVQIYINNQDGPVQGNNWRIWRARETDPTNEYADGRWRFMLYDTEMSLGLYNDGSNYTDNTLDEAMNAGWGWGQLLSKLLQNEQFRNDFVNVILDLRNTAFQHESAADALTLMKLQYETYSEENYLRNGPAWVIEWSDTSTRLHSEVNCIRKFINGRYKYIGTMLSDTLGLGELHSLEVSVNDPDGGTVSINTISPDLSAENWTGQYIAGCPVVLTAEPAPGYTFAGWTGEVSGEDPVTELMLNGDAQVTARFVAED